MKDRSDDPSHHERTLYLRAMSRSPKVYTCMKITANTRLMRKRKANFDSKWPLTQTLCDRLSSWDCGRLELRTVLAGLCAHAVLILSQGTRLACPRRFLCPHRTLHCNKYRNIIRLKAYPFLHLRKCQRLNPQQMCFDEDTALMQIQYHVRDSGHKTHG